MKKKPDEIGVILANTVSGVLLVTGVGAALSTPLFGFMPILGWLLGLAMLTLFAKYGGRPQ